ncbi:MAG TPA: (Fe-S)-binding protein [Lacipirellulaceae bacterium]|nr:(Fe-S)-binding protein [Lacipirellulaceae bacterium]
MRIGLFIPCYIDQFYPRVGVATLRLLEHFVPAASIEFPAAQTCCGQPMANAGCNDDARPVAEQFVRAFRDYDYVVGPSGSCVAMVRKHYHGLVRDEAALHDVEQKTFELCEFLVDVLRVGPIAGSFPHRVGLHQACHGLRELQLGSSSERNVPAFSKMHSLVAGITGLTVAPLERPDECCGFGGSFAVFEEAVSCMMGNDRVADHRRGGAEVIASGDMSCLMHMDGLIRRQSLPVRTMHIAELLTEAMGMELD